MSILDSVPVPRRTMVLFFIVDTSGSMSGNKIGAINNAIRQIMPMLEDISASNADAEIKVAMLQFSSGVEWLYSEPKPARDVEAGFIDFEADGLTDLGEACLELNNKLSRSAYMQSATGSFAPAIILLSDGEPTDNYRGGITKLKENRWFKAAIKIAIAIGEDADTNILKEFTGNIEAVFTVHNIEALKKIIRTVSVTASQIGSKSSTAGEIDKQTTVIDTINKTLPDTPGAEPAADPDPSPADDDWD